MRILTWNLWWRYGPWEQRREAIAATLAEQAPDVCGLQEVWCADEENLAADLAARLGMHWCWASLPVRGHGPELRIGNAVLSRWPIAMQAEQPLPTDGLRESRVAVHALIKAPGGTLPFFTTHLSYGPGLSDLRVQQVRSLAWFVAHRSAECTYPPVVTGDLNAEPDSDELRMLGGVLTAPAAPGVTLLDSWRYAAPNEPGSTWDRRNGYQAHSVIPDSRIDYILVGLPRGDHGWVDTARLAGDKPVDGVWPSDHFAVVADLQD